MALKFHRGLAIPLWAIAFCAVALSSPSRLLPLVTALLGFALIAPMFMTMVRRLGILRPVMAVAPMTGRDPGGAGLILNGGTGTRVRTVEFPNQARTEEANDALDLVRMDDDGGWRVALDPSLGVRGAPDKNRGSRDTCS